MIPASDDPRPSASKPTLEELLRLKRAERPDEAFWRDFDRGLRQKQLAAIIEPRPWWLGLALLGRRFSALGLPVSAGAAALLAVVVLRTQAPLGPVAGPVEFGPAADAAVDASSLADAAFAPVFPSVAAADLSALGSGSVAKAAPLTAAAVDAETLAGPGSGAARVAEAAPGAGSIPVLDAVAASLALPLEVAPAGRPAAPTFSQRTIARNLAVVKAEDPDLLASAAPDLAATAAAPAPEDEPLRMVVFNPRHARALVALADTPVSEAGVSVAHLRERVARSLDQSDALYGSVSRLGVGGDRLSLSF